MKRLEKSIGNAFVKKARLKGWLPVKVHGSSMQSAGLTDYIVMPGHDYPGAGRRLVWLEIKRPSEKLRPLQVRTCLDLAGRGCRVAVCDDEEYALFIVHQLMNDGVDSESCSLLNADSLRYRLFNHKRSGNPGGMLVSFRKHPLTVGEAPVELW